MVPEDVTYGLKVLTAATATTLAAYYLFQQYWLHQRKSHLLSAARRKVQERNSKLHPSLIVSQSNHLSLGSSNPFHHDTSFYSSSFPSVVLQESFFLPDVDADLEQKISSSSATQLIDMMRRGDVTCEQVMRVFCLRSRVLGRYACNAVTEELYEEAIQAARQFDQRKRQVPSWDPGLLAGLPISVKENFIMKGCQSTCGIMRLCDQAPALHDGPLVHILKQQGAIPFVRSNVSQLLMQPNSDNAVWGCTNNPYDAARTPGGSSGGEAALISLRASPLGLGTDVGGSVRIPAHFTGIVAFKPTNARITKEGIKVPRPNYAETNPIIKVVPGPMANSVDDVALLFRALISSTHIQHVDPYIPYVPFDDQIYQTGIQLVSQSSITEQLKVRSMENVQPSIEKRIGVIKTDHWFTPAKPCVRALDIVCEKLKQQENWEIVDITDKIPADSGKNIARLFLGLNAAEGNMRQFTESLDGESISSSYRSLKAVVNFPNFLRDLLVPILTRTGQTRLALLLDISRNGGIRATDYLKLTSDLAKMKSEWIEFMNTNALDCILLPGLGLPAFKHENVKFLTLACGYTFLANLLHWPAGSLPVTTVQEDEEQNYYVSSTFKDMAAMQAHQTMIGSKGLPVNIQVMTKPFEDEHCLYIMKKIEALVGFNTMPELANVNCVSQVDKAVPFVV